MSPQIISFNCVLKNLAGHIISSTYNKDVLTSINDEHAVLLGLARGLQGLKEGERRRVQLSAEEAYGFYDPKKVVHFPREKQLRNVGLGKTVTIIGRTGASRVYKVIALHDDTVCLDANHPLAGQDLVFEIETLSARDATADEVAAASNQMSEQLLH